MNKLYVDVIDEYSKAITKICGEKVNAQTIDTMMSSDKHDWNTPSIVLNAVKQVNQIMLDPCSNETSIVGAKYNLIHSGNELDDIAFCQNYTPGGTKQFISSDGLQASWQFWANEGTGLVFVNPPYDNVAEWMEKCVYEYVNGCEIIALVPSRTDTKWWHKNVTMDQTVCFWKGRLKFLGGKSCAPFPSALIYYGQYHTKFTKALQYYGMIVSPCGNL